MSTSESPRNSKDSPPSMNRREFLRRAGATGLAVAGSVGGAAWLYDPRDGGQYFRDQ